LLFCVIVFALTRALCNRLNAQKASRSAADAGKLKQRKLSASFAAQPPAALLRPWLYLYRKRNIL